METKVPSFVCGSNIYCNKGCTNTPGSSSTSSNNKHKSALACATKMNPIDPTQPDPRVSLWSSSANKYNQCCIPPFPKPLPPLCYNMKLRQLEDCYMGQQSDACRRRRTNFYKRWQYYVDDLPKRYPNYDYKTYCCDDYVDLSKNNDFVRYFEYGPNHLGSRAKARANFLFPRILAESLTEQETERSKCSPIVECDEVCVPRFNMLQDLRTDLDKQLRLYQEEPYTFWHNFQLKPEYRKTGFVYCSPVKSRISPFKKDASFSTPLDQLSTGNDPPFKELRDLKMV